MRIKIKTKIITRLIWCVSIFAILLVLASLSLIFGG